jgi:protein disulfide-isomerase A1
MCNLCCPRFALNFGGLACRFTDSMTTANIIKFAKGIVSGDVEPDFNSAEIPKNDVEDGVKIVVGKTFEKIVLDKTKDVLLEVYAPWCGHCKALEPIYKQLAERFKDIDSVVIAKMDGTANEHPDMEVEGFPTILFFPAEDPEDSDGAPLTTPAVVRCS